MTICMRLPSAKPENQLDNIKSRFEHLSEIVFINIYRMRGDCAILDRVWLNSYAMHVMGIEQNENIVGDIHFIEQIIHPEYAHKLPPSVIDAENMNNIAHDILYKIKLQGYERYMYVSDWASIELSFGSGMPYVIVHHLFLFNEDELFDTDTHEWFKRMAQQKYSVLLAQLTKRKTEILIWIAEGKSDKEIANICNISQATVKKHRNTLLRKLNMPNSPALAAFAVRCGLC
jgi:DNA-binding CsgD family transcriptional regulator